MNTLDERNVFEAQQGRVADVELLQQSNIAGIVFTHYMSTIYNTIRVFKYFKTTARCACVLYEIAMMKIHTQLE